MGSVKLRTATNADAATIRAFIFGILAEFDLVAEHEGVDVDLDDIQSAYLDSGGVFEVIEDEQGALIGTVGLYPRADGVCELRKMYLAPHWRGRGLGRRMLERMIGAAKQRGFTRIELETAAVLDRAIDLYRRYGFKPIDPEALCARCDQAFALDL